MRLSKSKLVAYRQCPKRLWLQTYRRELAQQSEAVENRMAQGNLVGAAAQRLYPEGRLIGHVTDLNSALRETEEALAQPGDVTLFEPALRAADVLVRADILIRRDGRYRMVEVKASTKVKDSHVADAAIQTWVARGAGLDVARIELAHIDNRFVYPGDGDYRGLFAHADMTAAVLPLQEQIPVWIAAAQRDLAGPIPDIAVGPQCNDPFECEFRAFCSPAGSEYPVELLPNSSKLARQLRSDGFADLRDVPLDRLTREDHQRIWRATKDGQPELEPATAVKLAALPWPRYYLDFETVGPAVPMWKGTRPYQKIPMQWSCHRQDADGTLAQLPPYLDTTGQDPRRAFADSLIAAIGDTGTILVYNATFERGVIMQLAEQFDDLALLLRGMAGRLFDLLPFAREHYYHPAMMGSWSIKRVLPTIAPDLDYGNLESVQSGDMVEPVYFEMVDAGTSAERKIELKEALLTYCERDTLGMVRVAAFFGGCKFG
jgi:CRISPR/Cas system-associated exonuclease Cas4 (RecB family)